MKKFSSSKYLAEIEASGLSVTGPLREDNQDAILLPNSSRPEIPGALFAVADGMGGYAHGGIASALALETLFSMLHGNPDDKPDKALRRGVEAANLDIYRKAQNLGVGRMGTTITAAYILGDRLHLAHVGDSRAYLIRQGRMTCLTNDHTVVGDMVRARLISPEKVRTHAQRSILTRALGLTLFVQTDIEQITLHAGDRLILCSDGVWSCMHEREMFQAAIQSAGVDDLGQKLVDLALEHDTDDNCSAVVLHIRGFVETETAMGNRSNGRRPTGWLRQILGGGKSDPLEINAAPRKSPRLVNVS